MTSYELDKIDQVQLCRWYCVFIASESSDSSDKRLTDTKNTPVIRTALATHYPCTRSVITASEHECHFGHPLVTRSASRNNYYDGPSTQVFCPLYPTAVFTGVRIDACLHGPT